MKSFTVRPVVSNGRRPVVYGMEYRPRVKIEEDRENLIDYTVELIQVRDHRSRHRSRTVRTVNTTFFSKQQTVRIVRILRTTNSLFKSSS